MKVAACIVSERIFRRVEMVFTQEWQAMLSGHEEEPFCECQYIRLELHRCYSLPQDSSLDDVRKCKEKVKNLVK